MTLVLAGSSPVSQPISLVLEGAAVGVACPEDVGSATGLENQGMALL